MLDHFPKPRRFAIGEDATPGEGGQSGGASLRGAGWHSRRHRHGLGEQHRRVRVISSGEVDEPNRDEHRISVGATLQIRNEVGPDGFTQHRFEEAVGRPVLGVHREDHYVDCPIYSVGFGVEGSKRVIKVRDAKATLNPGGAVFSKRFEVGGIVGNIGGESRRCLHEGIHCGGCARVVRLLWDAAIFDLHALQSSARIFDGVPVGGITNVVGAPGAGRQCCLHSVLLGTK